MKELGEAIRNWIATAIIVFLILFGTIVYLGIKEVTATAKVKNIEPGDKFKVEYITENPYENNIIFGGTVISRQGNYIQYVNLKGDTTSTNIRDAYLFPKRFNVTVTKPNNYGE